MKKIFLASLVLLSFCFGINLDTSKTQMYWVGYKLANKTAVKGSFSDVKFKFGKGDGISAILTGATAKVDLGKVVTGNPESEKNLTLEFFKKFAAPEIKAKIEKVFEGEKNGTILLKVTMNKKSQFVPMQYTIENGQLTAKGVIDLFNFKLEEAYASLAKACKDHHEGYTWSQVEIGFTIPTK